MHDGAVIIDEPAGNKFHRSVTPSWNIQGEENAPVHTELDQPDVQEENAPVDIGQDASYWDTERFSTRCSFFLQLMSLSFS